MFRGRSVWFFLLPGLTMLLVFYLIPFAGGIRWSLLDGSYRNAFVGADNYVRLWNNSVFLLGLKNTLLLSVICAPLLWVLSFLLASSLNRIRPCGFFARFSVFLPYFAPSAAVIMIWQLLFDYGGPLNRLLETLGLPRMMWLNSPAMRVPIVVMFLWKNLGLCTVVFLSALQAVPASLYESAELDGIGWFRRLFSITFPMISPTAYLVFILSWINAFKIFREVYFLSGAYPDEAVYTLQHYINNVYARLNYQMVTAAAYSFALIVLVLFGALFLLQRRSAEDIYG